MTVDRFPYLIVGGAPKAGTSSLFRWLSDHPDICPSSVKETRFFLDPDYPLPAAARFDGGNLAAYDAFFSGGGRAGGEMRLEATPDYLYSRQALAIPRLLPQARIVFVLRDPVDRMVSWYRYARQRGLLEPGMPFDDYVERQLREPVTEDTPMHLRALEQCRYEKYLVEFRRSFGERCLEVDFAELAGDPMALMRKICDHAGLSSECYANYSFSAENVSSGRPHGRGVRAYRSLRRRLAHALHGRPQAMTVMRRLNRLVKRALETNDGQSLDVQASPETAARIRRYLETTKRN